MLDSTFWIFLISNQVWFFFQRSNFFPKMKLSDVSSESQIFASIRALNLCSVLNFGIFLNRFELWTFFMRFELYNSSIRLVFLNFSHQTRALNFFSRIEFLSFIHECFDLSIFFQTRRAFIKFKILNFSHQTFFRVSESFLSDSNSWFFFSA